MLNLGMGEVELIIGPPGVGKTTEALRIIQAALDKGVPADGIGLISFTRAAVKEARDRMGVTREQGKWFRTLHSVCYELTGAEQADLLLPETIYDMRDIFGEEVVLYYHIYSLHRVTGRAVEDIWKEQTSQFPVSYQGLMRFYNWYIQFKEDNAQQDFYDLLDDYVKTPLSPLLDLLIIDEAQDMNLQQWRAVQAFALNTKKVYIIGDPDQSIYDWAGVVSCMEEIDRTSKRILDQSYRVPRRVHTIARNLLIKRGRDIQYSPRDVEGEVTLLERPDAALSIANQPGKWLILCRTRYAIMRLLEHYQRNGLYIPEMAIGADGKFARAFEVIQGYKALQRGEVLPRKTMNRIQGFCDGVDPLELVKKGLSWKQAFTTLSADTIDLYDKTEQSNQGGSEPRVQWATFHGSKGTECDNVLILGDCNKRVIDGMGKDPDPELRLLYVAVTRAKERLVLAPGFGKFRYNWSELLW